jgi:hypothetical protein
MEDEKLESLLIDYIDGHLQGAEKMAVEKLLRENNEIHTLHGQLSEVIKTMQRSIASEPAPVMEEAFNQMLQREIKAGENKNAFLQTSVYRLAAALILVVLGGGIGFWISEQSENRDALKMVNEQRAVNKHAMMTMLNDQQSASQRVQGANVAYALEGTDDEIVRALENALTTDPNTNVRMAALDALSKFHSQPHVRKVLVAALAVQKDPMVQISLIRILVEIKERDVVKHLKHITTDSESLPAVKDEAHAGLLRLS